MDGKEYSFTGQLDHYNQVNIYLAGVCVYTTTEFSPGYGYDVIQAGMEEFASKLKKVLSCVEDE